LEKEDGRFTGVLATIGEVIIARLWLNHAPREVATGNDGGGVGTSCWRIGATMSQAVSFQLKALGGVRTKGVERIIEIAVWSDPVGGRDDSQDTT
jgi:hypothetical protein